MGVLNLCFPHGNTKFAKNRHPFLSFQVSSAGSNRKRGTLVKKKLSSGAVAPFSSSEPDLLTLTDLFRISRIASLEGGTSQ